MATHQNNRDSDLHNFDSGAESAAALQPRATPWVSELIGASLQGRRIPPPLQGEHVSDTSGALPGLACPRVGAYGEPNGGHDHAAAKKIVSQSP